MIEFSYWAFPLIAVLFVFLPALRAALLPGLVAAGIAGAANSVLLGKLGFAEGHALAAALVVVMYRWLRQRQGTAAKTPAGLELPLAFLGACTWAVVAVLVCALLPRRAWPYLLTPDQMQQLFVLALPFGVAVIA